MNKKIIILVVAILMVLGVIIIRDKSIAPTTETDKSNQADQSQSRSQSQSQTTPQQTDQNSNNNSNNQNSMKLKIETTQPGTGNQVVKNGDTVSVQYTGKLTDGTVFDSTANHGGQPFTFTVGAGQVIQGWDQGLLGMKVGEKRTLTIPPSLGYGESGVPGVIPPNATLIFDIQLVSIK